MNLSFVILCSYLVNILYFTSVSCRFFRNLHKGNTTLSIQTKNIFEKPETFNPRVPYKFKKHKVIAKTSGSTVPITQEKTRARTHGRERVHHLLRNKFHNKSLHKNIYEAWNKGYPESQVSKASKLKGRLHRKTTKRKSQRTILRTFYIKNKFKETDLAFIHITTKEEDTILSKWNLPKTTSRSFHHRHYYRKFDKPLMNVTDDALVAIEPLHYSKPKGKHDEPPEYIFEIWPTAAPPRDSISTMLVTYTTVTTTTKPRPTFSTMFGNITNSLIFEKVRQSIINEILGLDYDEFTSRMVIPVKTEIGQTDKPEVQLKTYDPADIKYLPEVVTQPQVRSRKTWKTVDVADMIMTSHYMVPDMRVGRTEIRVIGTSTAKGKNYSNCFECGLIQNQVPYASNCYDIFSDEVNTRTVHSKDMIRRKCNTNVKGCVKRFTDVDSPYYELACRSWPPIRGKSFGSERFFALEKLLVMETEGCVMSPHAVLTAYSPGVSLWVRFGVCVCQEDYCNAQCVVTSSSYIIVLVIVIAFM